jgi:gamma-glutamyl phosphate reductase
MANVKGCCIRRRARMMLQGLLGLEEIANVVIPAGRKELTVT